MSRATTRSASVARSSPTDIGQASPTPAEIAAEVVTLLAVMTYAERVRAYRSGALSRHELSVAAARFPDQMPLLNDEYEWISTSLVDLE